MQDSAAERKFQVVIRNRTEAICHIYQKPQKKGVGYSRG
uniref:Uncharacterized protein n=1 Tax=Arundo donax TaxID=35708 RepID=A0A0A9H331_ARUDO